MSSILKATTRLQALLLWLILQNAFEHFYRHSLPLIATKKEQIHNLFLKEKNFNKTLTFIIEFRYNNNCLFG
ncbi:hypothetical protein HPLT_04810 [Helicobacter pylori Lithuania75]|uniref:hypothetical protein n=1 Tax=Helicobacter pylori TaxID=210 RepID=UPI0001F6D5D2|nr:hypothetical protein [Helicobacter pylori]ADU83362.1 hypothetical protein HPLT_04810 [Helicobacter pylori Lithuania75]